MTSWLLATSSGKASALSFRPRAVVVSAGSSPMSLSRATSRQLGATSRRHEGGDDPRGDDRLAMVVGELAEAMEHERVCRLSARLYRVHESLGR